MADATPPAPTGVLGRRLARLDSQTLTRIIEAMDGVVYTLVGLFFLVAALVSLVYGVGKFFVSLYAIYIAYIHNQPVGASDTASAIINFVSDLLLTLIIMEVLGTVVHYLQTRATSLKPFLFIGIISATRGILAVGARLSVTDFSQLHGNEFTSSMIELGVNAGVIIALGVALRLIGNFLDDESNVTRRDPTNVSNDASKRDS
jgi:uncharacterized membrane protein (DUF373 family)